MQLGRMGEIYKGAEEVVVWLGEEEEEGRIGEDVQRFEEVVRRVEGSFPGVEGNVFWEARAAGESQRVHVLG